MELAPMIGSIESMAERAVKAAQEAGLSVWFTFNGVKVWARPTSDHRDIAEMAMLAAELLRARGS